MNLILPCQPGCCEQGCEIASDNFNRPDTGDINDGAPFEWSGLGPDMAIGSNTLGLFSGGTERLTCGTSHPGDTGSGVVSAVFTGTGNGEQVEVWLNGTDSDNCTVARLTLGASGTLQILVRVSGVDSSSALLSLVNTATDPHKLTLLYDASTGKAQAIVGEGEPSSSNSICTTPCNAIDEVGDYAGVAIGSNDGLIIIDDFLFQKLGDGVNGCPEILCDDIIDPCYIVVDSFNRSNSTDISTGSECGWTEVSGSWEISSNRLRCTAPGLAILGATHPEGEKTIYAAVTPTSSDVGAKVQLVFGYLDSSNYYYFECTFTSSVFAGVNHRIMKVSGGTHTELSRIYRSMSVGFNHLIEVCVKEDGQIVASIDTFECGCPAQTFSGEGVGVGLLTSSDTVDFDNFTFSRSYSANDPDCVDCNPVCASCNLNGELGPPIVQIEIPSGTWAGTYFATSVGNCNWYGEFATNQWIVVSYGNLSSSVSIYVGTSPPNFGDSFRQAFWGYDPPDGLLDCFTTNVFEPLSPFLSNPDITVEPYA